MTQDIARLRELSERASSAWDAFVVARNAMNAARPNRLSATKAERDLYRERYEADGRAQSEHWSTAIKLAQHSGALLAQLEAATAQNEELKQEAELFDADHADQNRMVDRIADLIGLPHDQELDTTAFELWFSAQQEAVAAAWDAAGRKAHERLYPKNERADWTDIAAHNAYMANEVRAELFEHATAVRAARTALSRGGESGE